MGTVVEITIGAGIITQGLNPQGPVQKEPFDFSYLHLDKMKHIIPNTCQSLMLPAPNGMGTDKKCRAFLPVRIHKHKLK